MASILAGDCAQDKRCGGQFMHGWFWSASCLTIAFSNVHFKQLATLRFEFTLSPETAGENPRRTTFVRRMVDFLPRGTP
jgi:hypothetical protein